MNLKKRCIPLIFLTLCASVSSFAANPRPVAFIFEIGGNGAFVCVDAQKKARPIAVGERIYNDETIERTSKNGYFCYLNVNAVTSPKIVDSRWRFFGMREIHPSNWNTFAMMCGASIHRKGLGASVNEYPFLEWTMPIGAVMKKDIDSGKMALVFSPTRSSQDSRNFIPLVSKISPRYTVKEIGYRVVRSTLVVAEGQVEKRGDEWILPLDAIDAPLGPSVALVLNFTVTDAASKSEAVYPMNAAYRILANERTIEEEIQEVVDRLSIGADQPNTEMFRRMAEREVYQDNELFLYPQAN
jgi:hypothetical protein